MKHILTFDIEEARHMNIGSASAKIQDSFARGFEELLSLLKSAEVHATFFVVGETAQLYPKLIHGAVSLGHEIAFHSMNHKLVYQMNSDEFRNDLEVGKKILEDISGRKIIGYRAPSWSIDKNRSPWFWELLAENGFEYSSSIFPLKTPLYGDNLAQRFPHFVHTKSGRILEIPVPTVQSFRNLPFSGGAYFRFLFSWQRKILEHYWAKTNLPAMYYFHLRDLNLEKMPSGLSFPAKFINYFGRRAALRRFSSLIKKNNFSSVVDCLPYLKRLADGKQNLPQR